MIINDKEEAKKELILTKKGFKQNESLENIPEVMVNPWKFNE